MANSTMANSTMDSTTNDTAYRQVSALERLTLHLPVILYICVLIVFAMVGNILVLYIYHFRLKASIFGFFVQVLATLDLTNALTPLPVVLAFRLVPESLNTSATCKFLIFTNHFIALSSGFLLVIIAIQRYRKICCMLKRQIDLQLAKKLSLGAISSAFVLSLPIFFIVADADTSVAYGNASIYTPVCDYTSRNKKSRRSILYAALVDCEFLGITLVLMLLYVFIGRAFKSHASKRINNVSQMLASSKSATKIFFALTVVYILSVTPLLIISTYFSFFTETQHWSLVVSILFDLGVYLPYLNSVANPIIYSYSSSNFRTACKKLFICRAGAQTGSSASTEMSDMPS